LDTNQGRRASRLALAFIFPRLWRFRVLYVGLWRS